MTQFKQKNTGKQEKGEALRTCSSITKSGISQKKSSRPC